MNVYRAILADPLSRVGGSLPEVCRTGDKTSNTKESAVRQQCDTQCDTQRPCPTAQEQTAGTIPIETAEPVENRSTELPSSGTPSSVALGCRTADPLQEHEKGQCDTSMDTLRARARAGEELERTREELDNALEEAFDSWE